LVSLNLHAKILAVPFAQSQSGACGSLNSITMHPMLGSSFAGMSIVLEKQWKAKAAMAVSHRLRTIITKL
jgi:hypothetical protein